MSIITPSIHPDYTQLELLLNKHIITNAEQNEIKILVKKNLSLLSETEINKSPSLTELKKNINKNLSASRWNQINTLAKQNLLPLLKTNSFAANTTTSSPTTEKPKVLTETPIEASSTSTAIKQESLASQNVKKTTDQLTNLSVKKDSFKANIEKTIENLGSFLNGLKSRGADENQDQLRQDYDRQISDAEIIKASIAKKIESTDKKKSEIEFESHLLPLIVAGTSTLCTTTSTFKLPVYADYFGINYRFKSLDADVTSICTTIKPTDKPASLLSSSGIQETLNTQSNSPIKKKLEDMLDDVRKLNADIVVFKENLLVKKYSPGKPSSYLSHLSSYSCDEAKLKEMNEKYKALENQQAYYKEHGEILLTKSQLKEFNCRLVKFSSRLTEVESLLKPEQKTDTDNSNYQLNPVLEELKSLHDQIVIAKENFSLEKEWINQLSPNEKKLRYDEIVKEFTNLESLKEEAIDAKNSVYSKYEKELKSTLENQTKELVDMNLKLTVINRTIKDIQNQFTKIINPTPKTGLESVFSYLKGSKS